MTTSMDHINEDIKNIKADFYEVIHHPYFRRYLSDPVIDHDQVVLLYYLLQKNGHKYRYIKNCVLSSVLVQTALAVHDTVENNQWDSELEKKSRQLTVLSGDYFSSLYYYFLAKISDKGLIRVFSRSIQEINEIKMSVYCNGAESAHSKRAFVDYRLIDSLLIRNIARFTGQENWIKPLDEFFYLKRLVREHRCILEGRQERGTKGMLLTDVAVMEPDYLYQKEIEGTRLKLASFSYEWPPFKHYIHDRMKQLLNEHPVYQEYVAEEG
ncbi:heptaprenyl diphosphate synthase component 1 [Bacillus sp. H-16]|uniref:heptaprenyl diphosphate synthase component 1 n=1 Tax=Alteribacter salitolerans TaxID=2912333 RepID=UPI001965A65E|nr:heptaprenyl diphosphate synthase component 1 [Alteribacter salitolerans]MBM7094659.1 heptaprenyl diphosphate synthase component 1 [Alteribacter salitolerans]